MGQVGPMVMNSKLGELFEKDGANPAKAPSVLNTAYIEITAYQLCSIYTAESI